MSLDIVVSIHHGSVKARIPGKNSFSDSMGCALPELLQHKPGTL